VVVVLVMLSLETFLILLLHRGNSWLTVVAVLVMLSLETFLILFLHRGTAG
jgi:hypothetical protein